MVIAVGRYIKLNFYHPVNIFIWAIQHLFTKYYISWIGCMTYYHCKCFDRSNQCSNPIYVLRHVQSACLFEKNEFHLKNRYTREIKIYCFIFCDHRHAQLIGIKFKALLKFHHGCILQFLSIAHRREGYWGSYQSYYMTLLLRRRSINITENMHA